MIALSLIEALSAEIEGLRAPGWLLLWMVVVAASGWVLSRIGPRLVRAVLGRRGRRRVVIVAASLARIAGLLLGTLGSLAPLIQRAPLLSGIVITVMVVAAALSVPQLFQNLQSGISLTLRSRFREGDPVKVGDMEGVVEEVGLLRVKLRTSQGGVTYVPASLFESEPVTVGQARSAAPLSVSIAIEHVDPARILVLERELALSPFRRADGGSSVEIEPDGDHTWVRARLNSWADDDSKRPRQYLEALLRQLELEGITPQPAATPEPQPEDKPS